ncbi:MAG: asparaginase [archaeon]|jgi:L-asparaginase
MPIKTNISQREVKGKRYFYLDTNFKTALGKWKKISLYIGASPPDAVKLKRKKRELSNKILSLQKDAGMLDSTKKYSRILPKICLLFCGGTIAMKRNEHGTLAPAKSAEELLAIAPEIKNIVDIEYKFITDVDSTNMQPSFWTEIAKEIFERYDKYDGFVITHGTDTMAYTASALSLALQNLNKPVVLTGSQMPPDDPATDAHQNLINACRVSAMNLRGVIVLFGTKLLQGNRSKKWSEISLDAFVSHLAPDIGEIATTIQIANGAPRKVQTPEKLILENRFEKNVMQITLLPGMDPNFINNILESGKLKGLILESFGAGNVPTKWNSLIPSIQKAKKLQIPVVVTTQCEGGTSSHMLTYEVGYEAVKAGAIPARDMTAECAAVKLMWALAQTKDVKELRKIMHHNYAGEITG